MGGEHSRDEMMAEYFDRMSMSMNWIGATMENKIQYFHLKQPPNLGINTWFVLRGARFARKKTKVPTLVERVEMEMMNDLFILFIYFILLFILFS